MTAISGTSTQALEVLRQYPSLNAAIDETTFGRAIAKKYSAGPEILDGEVFDLYTSLLASADDRFKQDGNNHAMPEGVLFSIDKAIGELSLANTVLERLGVKLCNLRTSSLWDTLSELLLASWLLRKLPDQSIVVDYPLEPDSPAGVGKDADVALIGVDGEPILIDAVAPQPINSAVSVPDQLVAWVERKYKTKFSAFCSRNPKAHVAVVVSLIKDERLYLGAPMKLATNSVKTISSPVLDSLPGLRIALACSYRCPGGKELVLDPIAMYSRRSPNVSWDGPPAQSQ